ncbi:3-deoxy-D-manno-octulosonic acid transferase [Wenyingzhuangia sp. 2_MG-2023]|uniref:3-deoxy-D-manno-octulosonic acid transferase n=1 Tax=Wenyingzhuangia sp. 2_MG-2023 TaxID=3062639 RepID=UPI0026E41D46|nr:glycosyltransferase N-terminal domain-containing protein [Wenyingzhuangia sp. 2_MG-2023]MDO6736700.1 glycosyltransferase N-terminal domain-containing protein [Wenyingzhuangia sp. 2_MG-2023]
MQFIYNIFTQLAVLVLKFVALFNAKIKLFVLGRKHVFSEIDSKLITTKPVVWVHVASLGEFEQGRPLIEEIKKKYSNHQILLTFFSPSGYEVRKNYELADAICYLPMDTLGNAKKFIAKTCPSVAIFVKYEFWPNYLLELKKHEIPTLLVSGIFRENQIFFKSYGAWMRKSLEAFTHFFVQDEVSNMLLKNSGFDNVTIAGDTRFDRVQKQLEANEKLIFIEEFAKNSHVLVAGSTWPEDEEKLVEYINNKANQNEKFIIAPHNINKEGIEHLKKSIHKKVLLFTEHETQKKEDFQVFVIDTVGILSKIYAYADVAYIGGGYTKSGVHNTLEAATFGLPILIGPNYRKFKEVKDLIALKGCISVNNKEDLASWLTLFYEDELSRVEKAKITKQYVTQNLGATEKIMKTIDKVLTL